MGIRLDWEVESQDVTTQIDETPVTLRSRLHGIRRLRDAVLSLALILAALFGGAGFVSSALSQRQRSAIEAVARAEIEALNARDRDAFQQYQITAGDWPELQSTAFDRDASRQSLLLTDEVLDFHAEDTWAALVLREYLDDTAYRVAWFYEHTDEGWRHAPPRTAFWGKQAALSGDFFDVIYYERDQRFASALLDQLDVWWSQACQHMECAEMPPRGEVRIMPDPYLRWDWASYDQLEMLIPSPLLSGVREDGALDTSQRSQLAEHVARYWAGYTIPLPQSAAPLDAVWLRQELYAWLRHRLDPQAPDAAFLGPLAAAYGDVQVPMLVRGVSAGQPLVPLLEANTTQDVMELPVDWSSYLVELLEEELRLVQSGYATEAALLYRDPGRAVGDMRLLASPSLAQVEPGTLAATSIYRSGDLTWMEMHFTSAEDGEDYLGLYPFRLAADRWVRTQPYLEDWGWQHQAQSGPLTVHYYALDAPAVEAAYIPIRQAHAGAARDLLGEAVPPSVEIYITPCQTAQCQPSAGALPGTVLVASPHVAVRPAPQTPADWLEVQVARGVIEAELASRLDGIPVQTPLIQGLVIWEMQRLGYAPPLNGVRPASRSLDDLWIGGTATAQEAALLLDILVEAYGPPVIPGLVRILPDAGSIEEWLRMGAGAQRDVIEREWLQRPGTSSES